MRYPQSQTEYTLNSNESGNIPTYGRPFPNHAGVAPRVDTGYDIAAARLSKERHDLAMARANCVLRDNSWFVKFFVKEVSLDIGLSGSTGQGRYTRDFYPKNIVMPSFMVSAQCLNQEDYGTIVEFVHQAQQKAVAAGILLQLEIGGGGIKVAHSMKGVHLPITCQGLIPEMPRVYRKGEYFPNFKFGFVVTQMFDGIYKELNSSAPSQANWIQIIEGLKKANFAQETTPKNVVSDAPSFAHIGPPLSPKGVEELTPFGTLEQQIENNKLLN